jgi:hypothetical protein
MKFISKSLFLAGFVAVASLAISPVGSIAQSNTSLPPGDYVYNPKTGSYVPFGGDPNRKRTDFVEDSYSGRSPGQTDSSYGNFEQDCENTPGLSKNARQIEQVGRFIKTKIVGKDDRCRLKYGPDATDADRAMYGTGLIFDRENQCESGDEQARNCGGTGHLVHGTDLVITNAHVFRYGQNRELQADPRKGFHFSTRVWSPKTKGYVIHRFKIKDVFFGTDDPDRHPELDYAFLRLEEHVGKVVDGLPVPEQYQIKPLPFKIVDNDKNRNAELTVGYNKEIHDFSKNCAPFSLTKATNEDRPERGRFRSPESLYFHTADTKGAASGSAIAGRDAKGKLYYVALHRGWDNGGDGGPSSSSGEESTQANTSNDSSNTSVRRNIAINASTFYKSFMEFAQE